MAVIINTVEEVRIVVSFALCAPGAIRVMVD
jgi:hypothetical protein